MANDDSIESLRCRLLADMKVFADAMYALDFPIMRSVLTDMRERVHYLGYIASGESDG